MLKKFDYRDFCSRYASCLLFLRDVAEKCTKNTELRRHSSQVITALDEKEKKAGEALVVDFSKLTKRLEISDDFGSFKNPPKEYIDVDAIGSI